LLKFIIAFNYFKNLILFHFKEEIDSIGLGTINIRQYRDESLILLGNKKIYVVILAKYTFPSVTFFPGGLPARGFSTKVLLFELDHPYQLDDLPARGFSTRMLLFELDHPLVTFPSIQKVKIAEQSVNDRQFGDKSIQQWKLPNSCVRAIICL
jgi:hypothetical protein